MARRDLSSDDRLPVVPFCPVRCACGAKRPFTYGQRGRLRYHRCQECGARYRSWEITPEDFDAWGPRRSRDDAPAG